MTTKATGNHVIYIDEPAGAGGATFTYNLYVAVIPANAATGDKVLIAIHEIQQALPDAGFVVGGRGLASRLRARPDIAVCRRVSEAVEAVDALIKRATLN